VTTVPQSEIRALGTVTQDAKLTATVSYIAVKSTSLPDILEFNFETETQAGLIKDNEYVVNYIQYRKKTDTGDYNEIICANKKNSPANGQVFSYTGATDLTNAGSALTGKKFNEAPTGHVATSSGNAKNHRKGFGTDAFKTETANGKDMIRCQAHLDISTKMDKDNFNAIFSSYDVKAGARVYQDALATQFKTIKDVTFDYTSTKPDYKFGDEFELSEEPQALEGFNRYEPFNMANFDSSLTGTGFVKLEGNYAMIPNFEALFWSMKFSLEMPTQYFDTSKYVTFYGTYAAADDLTNEHTFTCEIKLGDELSAEVKEYDSNFSFDRSSATQRLSVANAGKVSDTEGYHRNYDQSMYELVETMGGKSRQNCAAITEMSPETAQAVIGKAFKVKKFGAVYYDTKDAQSSAIGIETTK
jgi:hypothetical protein